MVFEDAPTADVDGSSPGAKRRKVSDPVALDVVALFPNC